MLLLRGYFIVLVLTFYSSFCFSCQQTLRSFGAIGNGTADDTAAVLSAFQSICDLNGEGLTYTVSGNAEIKNSITLSNARFIQKATSTSIRTLVKVGGSITLKQVTVDRGANERNGSITDAAGIFLSNVSGAILEDVEVKGNGYGSGIWIADSHDLTLVRPYVHDMRWSTATPPRYEQMFGIWIVRSNNVAIRNGRIQNLLGETGDNIYRSWQSDGIDLTGTKYVTITSTTITNTGEGIDVTGSEGNEYFEIANSAAIDSDSYGFKVANSGRYGRIRDSVAIRSGYIGFVVSGPSGEDVQILSSDINIERCFALNPGTNGRWLAYPISGFMVMQGDRNLDYPKRVRITDSHAMDNQTTHTMVYGFYNQVSGSGVFNTDIAGATAEGNHGFASANYGYQTIADQAALILGCKLKMTNADYYFDQSYLSGWTTTRLIADMQDAKNRNLMSSLCL